jgi:hypothetical protein
MSPRRCLAIAAVTLLPLSACAPAGQNVRAFRAYAQEDPSLKVSLDRIEDMARTLELVDRILTGMSYTPGDIWVRRLPLTDAEFRVIREDIRGENPYKFGEYEVPVLKCYRRHIENVLDEYKPPPEKAMYPSLLDALSSLVPRTPALKQHWQTYRDAGVALAEAVEAEKRLEDELAGKDEATRNARAGELAEKKKKTAQAAAMVESAKSELARDAALLESDAKLTDTQKKQIARDAFGAISVAFRVDLEALALAPIVAIQTIRSIPQAPNELLKTPTLKIVRQAWQLPGYISGIKERFTRQVVVLEGMTGVLAKALETSIDESPGMTLRESVVDQIVGITLDSIRVDLKAGGEAFIFSSIATAAQQSTSNDDGSKTETYDYRGRQFKLDYRVKPIVLATARLDLVLDWIRLPGVAALAFGYSTDRVYKSGGELQYTSLAQQLGIKGAASDVFDIGLGILGIRSSVKIAQFTGGEVRKVSATDVSQVIDRAPLQLSMTQVDVGYDILWAAGSDSLKAWMEELVVGFRYFKYTLPRILYELRNTSADPNHKTFVFNRESPIQPVDSQYYMAGISARIGVGESPRLSPFLDMALFGGAGPTSFYFLRDPAAGDVESNRDVSKQAAWVVNGGIGAGLRWRLLPRGFRARLDLRAIYRADFVYTQINRSNDVNGQERRTDFGSVDVFHGPQLAIRGAF